MKDRIVQHPNRYRLAAVEGQENVYDIVSVPGTIIEEGTLLNAENLLSDTTANQIGLGSEATVNDALSTLNSHTINLNKAIMANVLQLTLTTEQTDRGVTCTPNGDGTFTVNGTNDGSYPSLFIVGTYNIPEGNQAFRLTGCPTGGRVAGVTYYYLDARHHTGAQVADYGSGTTINSGGNSQYGFNSRIVVEQNATVNNLVFKPMISMKLDATYDDYVPWEDSFLKPYAIPKWELIGSATSPNSITVDAKKYNEFYVVYGNYSVLIPSIRLGNSISLGNITLTTTSTTIKPSSGTITVYGKR